MLKSTNKDRFLYLSVAVLLLLYLLSFTRCCSSNKKYEEIKTALVNPKYAESITELSVADSKGMVTLKKQGQTWKVCQNEGDFYLPVSASKMENMLNNLTSIRSMYKLSDKYTENNSFGLTDLQTTIISYQYSEGIHYLNFGNHDFSQNYRYMMTDKNTTVYEVSASLDPYLTTSAQSWCEPYLISQTSLGQIKTSDIQQAQLFSENKTYKIKDVEKLLELRHGGLPETLENTIKIDEINLELGNKNTVQLEIYSSSKESEYVVKSTYYNYQTKTVDVYYSKISQWTYNKIREITL